MAIPFVVAGVVAAATGLLGAGAYLSAKETSEKARRIYREKEEQQEQINEKLGEQQNETNLRAENLGKLKLNIYKDEISRFVDVFEKIKKLNIIENARFNMAFNFSKEEIKSMKKVSMNAKEVLGAGVSSLTSGALAGAGIYNSVMILGAASTGTAISSLSGVAATNATLAWLGGGSLATGGGGMALGAASLGLYVAGPAILVAGIIADSKAEKALSEANKFAADVDIACEKVESKITLLKSISVRCNEFETVLFELQSRLKPMLDKTERIVNSLEDNSDLTDSQLQTIHQTFAIAKTIKDVMNVSLIDDNGDLNEDSEKTLKMVTESL